MYSMNVVNLHWFVPQASVKKWAQGKIHASKLAVATGVVFSQWSTFPKDDDSLINAPGPPAHFDCSGLTMREDNASCNSQLPYLFLRLGLICTKASSSIWGRSMQIYKYELHKVHKENIDIETGCCHCCCLMCFCRSSTFLKDDYPSKPDWFRPLPPTMIVLNWNWPWETNDIYPWCNRCPHNTRLCSSSF